MTPLWTSDAIATATGGTAHRTFTAENVTFDSREVIGGELFIALRGEATDGHRFVGTAKERGAAGFLVGEPVDAPHVLVADTTAALDALARAARARTQAKIVGVTGSVGKTGTKEALKSALDRYQPGRAHASVKSYNNHTGVPLSLARMPADSRFGIFEMGMNHAGELVALTRLVRPHVALVTWIASAHRAYFDSDTAIADAKGEIFQGVVKDGVAIIPHDSEHRDRLIGHASGLTFLTFGKGEGADVRALRYALLPDCTTVTADVMGELLTFKIGMAGRHWLNNALGVLAAVKAVGGDLGLAGLALAEMNGLPGRGRRFRVDRDGGQAVVIDESYNANPASMAAALGVLGGTTPAAKGRRLAVLGSMRELGAGSAAFHADLAPTVTDAGVEHVILVGTEIAPLAEALKKRVSVEQVADAAAAVAAVERSLRADDVLLVKGSNSVGLGKLVAHLQGES